jgi:flagellar assembly protein FliH
MSCKILPRGGPPGAGRIQWKNLGTATDAQSAETLAAAGSPTKANEVNRLHNRVVELERAMEGEVRQARERAFLEGQQSASDAAKAEVQPLLEKLLKSCAEVSEMRAKIRRETEADIVTLTIAIAKRVLRRELSVDPEAIHGVVKAALEKIQTKEICLIRMHPDHVAQARAFFAKSGLTTGFEITADAGLQPGGLIVETKRGNLDASVETQLKEIERGFTDRLSR